MGKSVQQQMRTQISSLRASLEQPGTSADLSAEYGRLGTLLMAAEQIDSAETCYINAQTLAPSDARWPYYLGQLYRIKGPVANAAASFERALELQPDDVPTLVWLGEVYLSQGRPDEAEPLFSKAVTLQPKLVPALFGAGRVALARKDYAVAVRLLEECLAIDPRATATHYPLGMAYRGLGNAKRAQTHLEQQGDVKVRPADPLMDALDIVLESPQAYDIRGGRSLETGEWADAAAQFRKGLELDPASPVLRLRLGTALFQMADARGAQEQFEQVLRTSPDYARAHHSLAILAEAGGRHGEALARFAAAVKYGPNDASSRVGFADLLRRAGRLSEALDQYDGAHKLDPRRADATLGVAQTLAGLGRYQEAKGRLLQATAAYPDEPAFAQALARMLASAPDPRVRDGRRALAIVERLLKGPATTELGETLAMAFAELGQFDQAVRVQRDVMAANQRAGLPDAGLAMAANLELYESRKPSRSPWPVK
jgi:tetratricopeptide (TPR) repeat protein